MTNKRLMIGDVMKSSIGDAFVEYSLVPGLWIARCGTLFDFKTKQFVKPLVNNWGYHYVSLRGHMVFLHVAVCETFNGLAPMDNMVVDHVDGNKGNNSSSNLEWVTKSENITRAYENGLRSDNRVIYLRNVSDKSEVTFHTMQECSRFLGCNAEKIYRWLNGQNRYPFAGKYDIRYDDTNFKGLTTRDLNNTVNGAPRGVLLIDSDGNMSTYGTVGLAAQKIKCHKETLGRQLRGTAKPSRLGDKGYKAYYVDQYDGEIPGDVPDTPYVEPIKIIPVRTPTPIIVKYLDTGKTERYKSCEEYASRLGLEKSTIQKATRLVNWKGRTITYDREEQVTKI